MYDTNAIRTPRRFHRPAMCETKATRTPPRGFPVSDARHQCHTNSTPGARITSASGPASKTTRKAPTTSRKSTTGLYNDTAVQIADGPCRLGSTLETRSNYRNSSVLSTKARGIPPPGTSSQDALLPAGVQRSTSFFSFRPTHDEVN